MQVHEPGLHRPDDLELAEKPCEVRECREQHRFRIPPQFARPWISVVDESEQIGAQTVADRKQAQIVDAVLAVLSVIGQRAEAGATAGGARQRESERGGMLLEQDTARYSELPPQIIRHAGGDHHKPRRDDLSVGQHELLLSGDGLDRGNA